MKQKRSNATLTIAVLALTIFLILTALPRAGTAAMPTDRVPRPTLLPAPPTNLFIYSQEQALVKPLAKTTITRGMGKPEYHAPLVTRNHVDRSIESEPFTVLGNGTESIKASSLLNAETSFGWRWLAGGYFSSVDFIDSSHGWIVGGVALHTNDGGATWEMIETGLGFGDYLHGVQFVDLNHGWMWSDGLLLRTMDGGSSWEILEFVIEDGDHMGGLRDMFFADVDHGWAVGGYQDIEGQINIIHTNDGGNTWRSQHSGVSVRLNSVYFVNANEGWAVGKQGTILHTSDGGNTWELQYSRPKPGYISYALLDVHFLDANNGWAVGDSGYRYGDSFVPVFMHTSDGGNTWENTLYLNGTVFGQVHFLDINHGWVAGKDGTIWYTANGGDTWQTQDSGTEEYIYSMDFTDASNGWIIADNSTILHTSNGGNVWQVKSKSTGYWLNDVDFVDANNGWATDDGILHTSDGGNTWHYQDIGTDEWLEDVHFVDASNGWVLSGDGMEMFHTTDGGTTWQPLEVGTDNPLQAIYFVDAKLGWVVGEQGAIWHTRDGGTTWERQYSGIEHSLDTYHTTVYFLDASHGWVIDYFGTYPDIGSVILHTNNGGDTWEIQASFGASYFSPDTIYPWLSDLQFIDANYGWAVGVEYYRCNSTMTCDRPIAIHTTNGGYTWQVQETGFSSGSLSSVRFVDANHGWAILGWNQILHTSDGGDNWALQFSPIDLWAGAELSGMDFVDASHGWAVGGDGFVLRYGGGPPAKPPVVLVHGWQGLGIPGIDGNDCTDTPTRVYPGTNRFFGDLPQWLYDLDYTEIYEVNLTTGPGHTPRFEDNAECLSRQLESVTGGTRKAILITHSMGGLVSRGYMENENIYRDDIVRLITLGSPHTGVNFAFLFKFLLGLKLPGAIAVYCDMDPGTCQLSTEGALLFDLKYRSRAPSVSYDFIGGTNSGDLFPWLIRKALQVTEGPNDGVIGMYSATGRLWPLGLKVVDGGFVSRYQTDETHSHGLGQPTYFEGDEGQTRSCIRYLLGESGTGGSCVQATAMMAQAQAPAIAYSLDVRGHITSSQTVTHSLQVDADGASLFYLSWVTGTLGITLTNPVGTVIDPAYAAANTDVVTYTTSPGSEMTPPFAAYAFTTTVPGLYTATITADDVGITGTDYLLFAAMETTRTLSVALDNDHYQVGDTAVLTATLEGAGAGITGATVQATFSRSDAITDTLTLTDQGDGTYRGTYAVPNSPGYLHLRVTAEGSDAGTQFNRQVDRLLTVASQAVQLTGTYADRADDADVNGRYEALTVDVEVLAAGAGDFTFSADLVAGGDQFVAHVITQTALITGTQSVPLSFDGELIQDGGSDGPFTVTNLLISDPQNAGIPSVMADDVWTTAAYDHTQFGRITGDLDGDCIVTVVDIMLVVSRWNTTIGDIRYDATYDQDGDGNIDVGDIMIVATHWRETCE